MLPGPHLIAGAVIASKIGSFSWPVIVLALLSHIILDAIPHSDTIGGKNILNKTQITVVIIDFIIAASLIYIFFKDNLTLALFGAFWAVFPDFIDQAKLIFPKIKQNKAWRLFHYYHELIQSIKLNWFWGLSTQIVVVVLVLTWAINN